MKPKLFYIKATSGMAYVPQEIGENMSPLNYNFAFKVGKIKKLLFGRWQIDFNNRYGGVTPNTRLILYPSGIQEIKYVLDDVENEDE